MSALIITMAGESRRFREAGFDTPKYRLIARGQTLFWWSLNSLQGFIDAGWRVVLVGRADDTNLESFAGDQLESLGCKDFDLLQLTSPTDGQATTVMQVAELVEPDEQIVVYNIDTHVQPGQLNPEQMLGAGWIPCFPGRGDSWSFLRVSEPDIVTEVREKVRISSHATVGLYGFDSFSRFESAYERFNNAVGHAEKTEKYIAPLYNTLIDESLEVRSHCIDFEAVVPLGTPEEVLSFDSQFKR